MKNAVPISMIFNEVTTTINNCNLENFFVFDFGGDTFDVFHYQARVPSF